MIGGDFPLRRVYIISPPDYLSYAECSFKEPGYSACSDLHATLP